MTVLVALQQTETTDMLPSRQARLAYRGGKVGSTAGVADVGHADDRARFRIELAEAVERACEFLGQDREIALDAAIGDPGGAAGQAGAVGMPGCDAGRKIRRLIDKPLCFCEAGHH